MQARYNTVNNTVVQIVRPLTRQLIQQSGFTLIEVAIAVFVLAIGILGIAGMQSVGVRESQNTYFRTQADMLVHDMLDRMRANRDAAQDETSSVYVYKTADGGVDAEICNSSGASCTPAEMAAFDLSQWLDSVQVSSLPNPSVNIARAAAGSVYTVQLFWDEDRSGDAGTSCDGEQACIQMVVEI